MTITVDEARRRLRSAVLAAMRPPRTSPDADPDRRIVIAGTWQHVRNWANKYGVDLSQDNVVVLTREEDVARRFADAFHPGEEIYLILLRSSPADLSRRVVAEVRSAGTVTLQWPY